MCRINIRRIVDEQVQVFCMRFCLHRWVSPRDGEIFIHYSLAATGDLPEGVPVRLTVSGKDTEMSDSSAPSERPGGIAFHREVLRMLYWFGVKVHKGSVLDFSLDFPPRDPLAPDVAPLAPRPSPEPRRGYRAHRLAAGGVQRLC